MHVGTGLAGREALSAIVDDPALELVGVKMSTPDKVGMDAGQLYGGPETGIAATDDLGTVMVDEYATDLDRAYPNAFQYFATVSSTPWPQRWPRP